MPIDLNAEFLEADHDTRGSEATSGDGRRLKVLVLDEEIPYPLTSGKRIRTWNLLRRLAHRHEITLVCYNRPDDPSAETLNRAGIRVVSIQGLPPSDSWRFYAGAAANLFSSWPYSVSRHHTRSFARAVGGLVRSNSYDLVHCEWSPYASYSTAARRLPMLIMAHNIETTVWRRRAQYASSFTERRYMNLQAAKMARFERWAFSHAARVVTVTEEERDTAIRWGARATSLVANGVDTEWLRPSGETIQPESFLFLGSLDWQPNRDALYYLLDEIFPRIRATRPDAMLRVVGRQPGEKLRKQVEGRPGIQWVGEVPDIRPVFAEAAAVLVPLRIGGGSRIKILESLSMEKAVVTTTIGAEGLDLEPGKHCLMADTPEDFARCAVEVMETPALAAELGANGRKLVIERYDWSRLALDLERAWIESADRRASV